MNDTNTEDITEETTVMLAGGSVEYSLEKAACSIEELIESLEQAREDGATHVVLSSGNYRGAQWATLRPGYDFLSEVG